MMFVMNTSLHILAFRLKYFPVEGAFNDCETVKLKNKRTNKGYMGIINISCLFRTYCFGINRILDNWIAMSVKDEDKRLASYVSFITFCR